MTFELIAGPGSDVEEPDWQALIPARADGEHDRLRETAHREWTRIVAELRDAQTLAPVNGRQVLRLVLAYLRYDLAVAVVMREGAVTKAPRTKVPMLSVWQTEMRAAADDANSMEMELCLNPRRRAAAGKVQRKAKRVTAADEFRKRGAG